MTRKEGQGSGIDSKCLSMRKGKLSRVVVLWRDVKQGQ